MNHLYYGDNLPILRKHIKDESVDLVYLDPPFNSDRNYNVLFKKRTDKDKAGENPQILAFTDTWTWSSDDEALLREMIAGATPQVSDCLAALFKILGQSDMMSYVVMMAPRLIELRRVLKDTGSIYLHCDPSASHYLRILLDSVFGPMNFVNEVVWQRTGVKGDARLRYGAVHDVILVYSKLPGKHKFNRQFLTGGEEYLARFKYDDGDGRGPYESAPLDSPSFRPNLKYPYKGFEPPTKGWRVDQELMKELDADSRLIFPARPQGRIRRKNYMREQKGGAPVGDVWTDISPLQGGSEEKLGYPTQKPLALLKRIIEASSNPGDVILDPFCGCGTAVISAQTNDRNWIGIDITYLAVELIRQRLRDSFGKDANFKVFGIPTDSKSARVLFDQNPFDFERWVVTHIGGHPNDKQVGDKGIDGRIRFWHTVEEIDEMIVSVKGGQQLNPAMMRDLRGTIEALNKPMGLFICLAEPTPGMAEVAASSGIYTHPVSGQVYPKLQILTVSEIFAGKRPNMPTIENPFKKATQIAPQAAELFD